MSGLTQPQMSERSPIVFVVDDDGAVRKALRRRIRSEGFGVETFASAEDFLAYERPPGPGCLVLDVSMPDMMGTDLQRHLAGTDLDLPIVFITGNETKGMRERCLKDGAVAFLDKPLDDEVLLDAIYQAIDRIQGSNLPRNLQGKRELEDCLLLRGVELESVRDLLRDCHVRELKEDEVLISAGQPNCCLFLLLSGRLRIHLKPKMSPLTFLGPGEIVGELSFIDGQPASAYVIADKNSRVLALDQKTMWSFVETSPLVARNLLFILSRRLRHGNHLISLADQSSEEELKVFEIGEFVEGDEDSHRQFQKRRNPNTVKRSKARGQKTSRVAKTPAQKRRDHRKSAGKVRLKDLNKEELIDHYLEEYRQQVRSEKKPVGERVDDTVEKFVGGTSPDRAVPRQTNKEEGIGVEQIYQESQAFVSESIRRAQKGQLPDIGRGEQLVKLMMDSIIHESALLLLATDRSQTFSVSGHCVNVAIVGLRIAQTLNYDLHRQTNLGLAALLHEIGIAKVASGVMPSRSNPDIQHRPIYSAEILKKLGPEYDWLVETVSQVFEREDGSGFPGGLAGKMICEEAKILGVGDAFEACIHDRPHRRALTGYQFLVELTSGARKASRIVL